MTDVRLSFIVPTKGRPSLDRTLRSIVLQAVMGGDEVIVAGLVCGVTLSAARDGVPIVLLPCRAGRNWGSDERSYAMSVARGTHLVFVDDDDALLPGAVEAIRGTLERHPGRPVMFRMIDQGGRVLWREPVVRCGNHGTPQFVVPNEPARLGHWGTRYEGDFDFVVSTLACYRPDALVWDTTVICGCREHGGTW
jgi:hypothetical protein